MLSVVVPSYNEGGNVRELVKETDAALKGIDYEIILMSQHQE